MSNEHSQWVVTNFGIEECENGNVKDGGYYIDTDRLTEISGRSESDPDDGLYDWPLHMAEKTWVRLEEFILVFCEALQAHRGKYKPPLDDTILRRSIVAARRVLAESLRDDD